MSVVLCLGYSTLDKQDSLLLSELWIAQSGTHASKLNPLCGRANALPVVGLLAPTDLGLAPSFSIEPRLERTFANTLNRKKEKTSSIHSIYTMIWGRDLIRLLL
jgi:hypothetical protein